MKSVEFCPPSHDAPTYAGVNKIFHEGRREVSSTEEEKLINVYFQA